MNPFEGLEDAKVGGDQLPHLTEGSYEVEIDRILYKTARAGYGATIAEFTVVESNNPAHPAGAKRSYFQKMNVDAALGAIKALGAALMGIDPKDKSAVEAEKKAIAKLMNDSIQSSNPCKGATVGLDVVPTLTKEKKPFTRHDWRPSKV